jgi:hypothetical protein
MEDSSNRDEPRFVKIPEENFLGHSLALGVAIQALAKLTNDPLELLKDWVLCKAAEQLDSLSAQEREAFLKIAEDAAGCLRD